MPKSRPPPAADRDDATPRKKRRAVSAPSRPRTPDAAARRSARALTQSSSPWGLAEVLRECGTSLRYVPLPPSLPAEARGDPSGLGCPLDPDATPSSLRASVHALLGEMRRSGLDVGNGRVIESLGDIVSSGEIGGDSGGDGAVAGGRHPLLRRMLLPMYRLATDDGPGGEGGPTAAAAATRIQTFGSSPLAKVLLRVDAIQPALLAALLRKLPELSADDGEDADGGGGGGARDRGEDDDLPRLILSQVRWIDHVVDPCSLTESALEVLSVLCSASASSERARSVLLDLIAALPDFLAGDRPSQVDDVVSTLRDVRVEDPALLVPCLDAIGSMRLTEGQLEAVTKDALDALESADVWSLPALAKFLTQNAPAGSCDDVVGALRRMRLGGTGEDDDEGGGEDEAAGGDSGGGGRNRGGGVRHRSDAEALTLEALSQGLQYRPDLTSSLLSAVRSTPPSHHPPSDVWLLLCAASAPHHRPRVLTLLRSKSVSGAFAPRLLGDALDGNGRALEHLFSPAALDLADGLVRSPEGSARRLGGALYESMYREFPDAARRQEVVGGLVTHVGSGGGGVGGGGGAGSAEVDAAMEVFSRLVEGGGGPGEGGRDDGGARSLRPYLPFLSSLLDHIRGLSSGQARRLFIILFAVGYDDDDEEDFPSAQSSGMGGGCDDVHIVIRKYLSLPLAHMKRIGIIGAVAFAVTRSAKCAADAPPAESERTEGTPHGALPPSSSPRTAEILNMLELAYRSCASDRGRIAHAVGVGVGGGGDPRNSEVDDMGSALAFLFDELCLAVRGGGLAPRVRDWILERFSTDLEDLYLGDFVDHHNTQATASTAAPSVGATTPAAADSAPPHSDVVGESDRSLLAGTSDDPRAPPGEMRFNIDGGDALVYVRFLPLLASDDPLKRHALPRQLCPLLRLLATCHDARYGGMGLSEIDAVLGCPLLLPTEASVGIDFTELDAQKRWTATACSFHAASWCRELVNSFVHSVAFPPERDEGGASGSAAEASSQEDNPEEVRGKVVEKLKCLVQLEEDLRFTASKCFHFAPPGLAPLPPPRELAKPISIDNDEDTLEAEPSADAAAGESPGSGKLSKEEKKALADLKKKAAKEATSRAKAKQRLQKIRARHEAALSDRSAGALRPLSPLVCLALGFQELSVVAQEPGEGGGAAAGAGSQMLSLGASQLRNLSVGGPLSTLLLTQLHCSLEKIFSDEKATAFARRLGRPGKSSKEETRLQLPDDSDNPYLSKSNSSGNGRFTFLETFLAGNVFVSLYEHLATIAEIRGGADIDGDDGNGESRPARADDKEQTDECIRLLFACTTSLMQAEELTASPRGRQYLEAVMKQLSEGDRETSASGGFDRSRKQASLPFLRKSLFDVFSNVEEIVMGGESDDLPFVMLGVDCLESVLGCAHRLESGGETQHRIVQKLRRKMSCLCQTLLRRKWKTDTKYNKGNVGKLVTLYIEHSFAPIPTDEKVLSKSEVTEIGRIGALTAIFKDALAELPNTYQCKGPVELYPTCCYQSFGSYFSAALASLPKEVDVIFDSSLAKSGMAVEKALEVVLHLVELLDIAFKLTKENSLYVKRPFLLTQLRGGTKFLETFVGRAVDFLQTHFQQHENAVVSIIKEMQCSTRQLGNIISHGKREKDPNLIKESPRTKKILETFVHKIKVMMRKNGCVTALWAGNLKMKHIDGSTVENDGGVEEDEENEENDIDSAEEDEEGSGTESESEDENEADCD